MGPGNLKLGQVLYMMSFTPSLQDCTVVIIAKKHTPTRQRTLWLSNGRWSTDAEYLDLSNSGSSWTAAPNMQYHNQFMYAISVSNFEAYQLGGDTHPRRQHTRWDPRSDNF